MADPICKIGVDIVNESEFKGMACDERALGKVFSERELEDCRSRGQDYHGALARRFAGKEAVVKAWGKGVGDLSAIEIMHDAHGKPIVFWDVLGRHGLDAQLSLSSAGPLAIGVAVLVPTTTKKP